MTMQTLPQAAAARAVAAWNGIADRVSAMVPEALIALVARLGIAAIFFMSGRTKVEGLLTVSDSA
jgi:putative oxidoreductase